MIKRRSLIILSSGIAAFSTAIGTRYFKTSREDIIYLSESDMKILKEVGASHLVKGSILGSYLTKESAHLFSSKHDPQSVSNINGLLVPIIRSGSNF